MEMDTFWQIIEAARAQVAEPKTEAELVAEKAVARLAEMPPEEIIGFGAAAEELLDSSYRWDLWAAAYLINGGCSDDGFDYFRGWLIAQGRASWERVLDNPDTLAELVQPDDDLADCEDMIAIGPTAYERATGDDEGYWAGLPDRSDGRTGPLGEGFDFDDATEVRRRLPRLSQLYT